MTSSSLPNLVIVRAPAKLNLFLELIRKREDGFHEIETVMVPINRYDTLVFRSRSQPGIRIQTRWWPSERHWADALGVEKAKELLSIPNDERNLIHRAITATTALSGSKLGFDVQVRKRIPAGAGMGGASSDAAAAIRAVAALTGLPGDDRRLMQTAAAIGSDVPFFFGGVGVPTNFNQTATFESRAVDQMYSGRSSSSDRVRAIRATGRGEILSRLESVAPLRFIVAFPATALSTALVYRESKIPQNPETSTHLIDAMKTGKIAEMGTGMMNRLSEPAVKISRLVEDLLQQMWHSGLPRCQLTGSGSACFSLLDEFSDVDTLLKRLTTLNAQNIPAVVFAAQSISIPQSFRAATNPQASN